MKLQLPDCSVLMAENEICSSLQDEQIALLFKLEGQGCRIKTVVIKNLLKLQTAFHFNSISVAVTAIYEHL